jgi:hypothetical protein
MNANKIHGRLSTWQAAFVIARRDFTAVLFSRSFIFFLLGPLFPVIVGGFAGGIGQRVQASTDRPVLGIAMQANDVEAMLAASKALAPRIGAALPELYVVKRLAHQCRRRGQRQPRRAQTHRHRRAHCRMAGSSLDARRASAGPRAE